MSSQVTVFGNGQVFDGRRHRGSGSVAVRDGRIVAVGATDVREYVDASTGAVVEEVDLAGGLLLPGFQDAHVHPVLGGLERIRCELSLLSSGEEYLRAVQSYAEAHPAVEWVRGSGWSMSAFGPSGPTAAELDRVVSDRPVFLVNRDHHGARVNSNSAPRACALPTFCG